jgi:CDP-diacylglycerol--glycerol-3-phosphate 3-phosphatidyltransferase
MSVGTVSRSKIGVSCTAFVHVPNVITTCRLLAAPVLLAAALERRASLFAWLLLLCLLSDIADGFIARAFRLQSRLGAALDSAADFLVTVVAVTGMIMLQWRFVVAHAWQLALFVGLLFGEVIVSLVRYHRLSSFHTYLVRISAYAQGIFFVGLFFWGYVVWLFYLTWIVSCLAELEEWILLALLPTWTHDVRGLYWVLKARRR